MLQLMLYGRLQIGCSPAKGLTRSDVQVEMDRRQTELP